MLFFKESKIGVVCAWWSALVYNELKNSTIAGAVRQAIYGVEKDFYACCELLFLGWLKVINHNLGVVANPKKSFGRDMLNIPSETHYHNSL